MTDRGLRRAHNEDAFLAAERVGLFLVCDGVGGRASGEVASAEAAASICDHIQGELSRTATNGPGATTPGALTDHIGAVLRTAMEHASRTLRDLARTHARLSGMSTTASVVAIAGGYAVVGHVGDSRVYHARGASIRQLTDDHTFHNLLARQGHSDRAPSPYRKSPITRALGLRDHVEVDIITSPLLPGDRLLLCTDGLSDYFDDDDTILPRLFAMTPACAGPAAIQYANRRGGRDNITALFVELEP